MHSIHASWPRISGFKWIDMNTTHIWNACVLINYFFFVRSVTSLLPPLCTSYPSLLTKQDPKKFLQNHVMLYEEVEFSCLNCFKPSEFSWSIFLYNGQLPMAKILCIRHQLLWRFSSNLPKADYLSHLSDEVER